MLAWLTPRVPKFGFLRCAGNLLSCFILFTRVLIWQDLHRLYRKRKRFTTLRTSDLRASAKRIRTGFVQSDRASGDDDLDCSLYNATQDELQRGWLHGPYPLSVLPENAIITRRLAVRQTESLVNATSAAGEPIAFHGIETICATIALIMRRLTSAGTASLLQCGVLKNDVLPFGACASVHGFCRTSYAIWRVAIKLLTVVWTVYFDDYVSLYAPMESKHMETVLRMCYNIMPYRITRITASTLRPKWWAICYMGTYHPGNRNLNNLSTTEAVSRRLKGCA